MELEEPHRNLQQGLLKREKRHSAASHLLGTEVSFWQH